MRLFTGEISGKTAPAGPLLSRLMGPVTVACGLVLVRDGVTVAHGIR